MQYTRLSSIERSELMSALARMPQWLRDNCEGLRAFATARAENLATLAAVPAADWARTGTQDGVGPVSLCDMPVFLHQHDGSPVAEFHAWRRHVGIDTANASEEP